MKKKNNMLVKKIEGCIFDTVCFIVFTYMFGGFAIASIKFIVLGLIDIFSGIF